LCSLVALPAVSWCDRKPTRCSSATTYDQVLQRYGDPRRTGTQVRNGETLKTVSYAYAVGTPFVDDVPARASGFYFLNGVLVGYEYLSSFREDKTDFDETKVQQIKKGETTRWRVIELFGQPGVPTDYAEG